MGEQSHILLLHGIKRNPTVFNVLLLFHRVKGMPRACMISVWKTLSYVTSQMQLLLLMFMPVIPFLLNVFVHNCLAIFCM